MIRITTLLALLLLWFPAMAQEAETFRYKCKVLAVTDGDTVKGRCSDFPPGFQVQAIRIDGVDTPESRRGVVGAKCDKEIKLGKIAKAWTRRQIAIGSTIIAVVRRNPGTDQAEREKYGRILGDIEYGDGKSLREELIKSGNARPYTAENLTKGTYWCD